MKFYKYLYTTEKYADKKKKICRRLRWNIGQINVHVITLAKGNDLLEIYHCALLQQKNFRRQGIFIVGIAEGYEEAVSLSQQIISEIYQKTGDVAVKQYIIDQHFHKQE
ncbi:MAG: hypothetical protein PHS74_10640 [Lachnospiraceae bacterium]|nr:hypothetical protein [Lachnospiraceae bacterium]